RRRLALAELRHLRLELIELRARRRFGFCEGHHLGAQSLDFGFAGESARLFHRQQPAATDG
ncbi:MAG TPA: hypothetical protein VLW85_24015, partial [Myxococcales bacterium]|nr:hypothetical protein [Myxococcales bacterium]